MAATPFNLEHKVAVVTGASQGIGRAISIALAQSGATVAVTNIASKRSDVDTLVREIQLSGGAAQGYDLDVTVVAEIANVFDTISADLGSPDILVNNAGVRAASSVLDATEELWDSVTAVNLKGTFFASQAAARHMLTNGHGRIINVASQLAVTAAPNRSIYIATKGGVVALTKSMALEWAMHGITVNAIGPGPTDTPMTRSGDATRSDAKFLERSPIGRRLEPHEIAGSVVFLASDEASAVTGHLLLVDAGWSAG